MAAAGPPLPLDAAEIQRRRDLASWLKQYRNDTFLVEATGGELLPQPSLWFALWAARAGDGADVVPGVLIPDENRLRALFNTWWELNKHLYEAQGVLQADGKISYPHRRKGPNGEWQVYTYRHQPFVPSVVQLLLVSRQVGRRREYEAMFRRPVELVCTGFGVPEGGGQDAATSLMRLLSQRRLVGPFLDVRRAAHYMQTWSQHLAFQEPQTQIFRNRVISRGSYGVIFEGERYMPGSFDVQRLAVKEVEIDANITSTVENLFSDPACLERAIQKATRATSDVNLAITELVMLYDLRDRYPDAHLCYPLNHEVTEVAPNRFAIRFTMQRHDWSLQEFMQQGRLMPEAVERILEQVLMGLETLQTMDNNNTSLALYNLKPSNILLKDGRVVLCDFGSAATVEHATEERSPEHWPCIRAFTPLYMAPEVRAGINRLCGRRSDMWSFGVLVAQMLLGREPLALMLSVLRVAQEPAREHSVMQAVQRIIDEVSALPGDQSRFINILRNTLCYNPLERKLARDLRQAYFPGQQP